MAEKPHVLQTNEPASGTPRLWHTQSETEAAAHMSVAVEQGLSEQDACARFARSGPNVLREARTLSF